MDLRIVDWSPERFLFVWTDPLKPNGRITHYKVFVNELEPLYYVPAHCRDEVPQRVVIDSTAVLREFVAVVKPYTKYELSVKGVNGAGDGQSVTIIGVTSPSGEFVYLIDAFGIAPKAKPIPRLYSTQSAENVRGKQR